MPWLPIDPLEPYPALPLLRPKIVDRRRNRCVITTATIPGIQTQTNSLWSTRNPDGSRNRLRLKGDTLIGRKLKKYLVFSNGIKKPMPKPPVVMASKASCAAMIPKKHANTKHQRRENVGIVRNPTETTTSAMHTANRSECENPRWPKGSP